MAVEKSTNLKIISIGFDKSIFNPQSITAQQMVEYASVVDELHVIVFSLEGADFFSKKIAPNAWAYQTNSPSKFSFFGDVVKIGKSITENLYFGRTIITTKDAFESGVAGVCLKLVTKFPLQIQIHTDVWSKYFRYSSVSNFIRSFLVARIVLWFANSVRVVSQKIGRDAISYGKVPVKKILVLPPYIDAYAVAMARPSKDIHHVYPAWKTIVLIAADLLPHKNIGVALKIFQKVILKHSDAGLVIVGTGPQAEKLHAMVSKYNLSQNVALEEWQPDIEEYIKTADIYLNTALYEGYERASVKASAAGAALVTTRVGLAEEFIEHEKHALVCEPKDEKCIYDSLVRLIEDPALRKTLGGELQETTVTAVSSNKEEHLTKWRGLFEKTI